jgi:hypothetical protein
MATFTEDHVVPISWNLTCCPYSAVLSPEWLYKLEERQEPYISRLLLLTRERIWPASAAAAAALCAWGGRLAMCLTFEEPGLIQVTASYNLAYLGAQRRQATDGGFFWMPMSWLLASVTAVAQDQLVLSVHVTQCKGFQGPVCRSDQVSQSISHGVPHCQYLMWS